MKLFVFFTLLLILIVGCIQEGAGDQVPTITNEGVIVTNFTSDSTTLRINEETNLKVLLKNVGSFEANNISSILYGEGLLERIQEINTTRSLLKNFEDLHVWTLRVPLKLSQTESTIYTVNARIFYLYNYSGFQQVGFVEPTYTGGDLPLSSGFDASPLRVNIEARNPIRTLGQGSVFSITITITNVGSGNVDYFDCSPLRDPPCNKGGYINILGLTAPRDWEPVTNMSAWNANVSPETETTYYELNFDKLEADYNNENCRQKSGDPECILISEAINQLRMIRGNEARLVLLFNKSVVSEPTIDSVEVKGDFGYEIDTSDFMTPVSLLILGD